MALEAEAMDEIKATGMMMVSVGDPSTYCKFCYF